MSQSQAELDQQGRLAERVMGSSSAMVGACATLVGLVKLNEPRQGLSRLDEYAALTAVAFVVSTLLAYLAVRTPSRPVLRSRMETVADLIFLAAMVALVSIGVVFAYDLV